MTVPHATRAPAEPSETTPWTIDGSMPIPAVQDDTVSRADVLAIWNHWRLGLSVGAFHHSDGVEFFQALRGLSAVPAPAPSRVLEPAISLGEKLEDLVQPDNSRGGRSPLAPPTLPAPLTTEGVDNWREKARSESSIKSCDQIKALISDGLFPRNDDVAVVCESLTTIADTLRAALLAAQTPAPAPAKEPKDA